MSLYKQLVLKEEGQKIEKLDFIKIKNFSASMNTIMKTKRPPTEWEKIFENHISDKGLAL